MVGIVRVVYKNDILLIKIAICKQTQVQNQNSESGSCAFQLGLSITREITQAGTSTARGGILAVASQPVQCAALCRLRNVTLVLVCVLCAYNGDLRSPARSARQVRGHFASLET